MRTCSPALSVSMLRSSETLWGRLPRTASLTAVLPLNFIVGSDLKMANKRKGGWSATQTILWPYPQAASHNRDRFKRLLTPLPWKLSLSPTCVRTKQTSLRQKLLVGDLSTIKLKLPAEKTEQRLVHSWESYKVPWWKCSRDYQLALMILFNSRQVCYS